MSYRTMGALCVFTAGAGLSFAAFVIHQATTFLDVAVSAIFLVASGVNFSTALVCFGIQRSMDAVDCIMRERRR
ncbi:MAG: hypothetical protein ACYCW6_22290 [Candidatus Xenobia bacterium]